MIGLAATVTALVAGVAASAPGAVRASPPGPAGRAALTTPGIRVWTLHPDVYRRGDRAAVYYTTERTAYVMVFRIDTDGNIQVLFPASPYDNDLSYGGAVYTVSTFERGDAFYVDDAPGVGYIFGVAAEDPFDFGPLLSGGRWDLGGFEGGRIHGDPLAAMQDLVARLLPPGYQEYDTHLVPYYVGERYDYPRFVCYDCHAYAPFAVWDPYASWCPRYQLVLFDDPYYFYPSYWYGTRYYGARVVLPGRTSPRFQFIARAPSAPGIAYRDRSAERGRGAPGFGRGVRGTDIGGVGSVPDPTIGRRAAPAPGAVDERDRDQGPEGRRVAAPPPPPPTEGRRFVSLPPPRGADEGRRDAPGIEIVPRPAPAAGEPGQGDRGRQTPGAPSRIQYLAPSREMPVLRPSAPARPQPEEGRREAPARAWTPAGAAPRPPEPRQALPDRQGPPPGARATPRQAPARANPQTEGRRRP